VLAFSDLFDLADFLLMVVGDFDFLGVGNLGLAASASTSASASAVAFCFDRIELRLLPFTDP
jgi:hypothetical protein